MDPLPVLFEDSTGSGADTPLTFPSSPTREDNDGRKSVNGDLEGDGLEDWELSQDPLDLINCQEEEYRMSPLPPSSIPRTRPPSEHLEPTDGLFELDENKHSTVPSPSQVYPILPQPSHSPAPFPLPLHSKSPSPEPQQANTDGDAALAATLHAAASTQPIRALRQRQPHQQRPYTYDLLQYKRQMKRVPEAIVKMRHIEQDLRDHRDQRRKDGYRSEEESQEQEYRPPSEQEEDPRRSGQQRASLVVSATGAGDALIPDLPESSDDEEINDTRREAKKAEKERKKKERETERAEKEKERAEREKKSRLKSFPIKEKQQSRKRPRSLSAETRKSATRNATPGPSNRRHTRTPSPLPQPSPSDVDEVPMWDAWKSDDAPPSSHNVSDRDYRRSGSFDDHNLSPGPIPVSPMQHLSPSPLRKISRSRSRSHSTPHVPDLEVDSDYSGSASSRADLSESNAKKRKQLKALGRMVPRFMFPALGLNSDGDPISQPFNRKGMGKQQQIVNVSSDEEDADVRPGVARVRMGKGDLRPVMGDSESESEGGRGQSPLVPFDHHLDSELLHDPSPSKSYDVYNPLANSFSSSKVHTTT
ncbi:hypothetical protein BDP27DRAFT_345111 [Rhodocollybia butyracea]|uniref:Uncharacterized protein n=1 Tax=Rhodocollybia butyracea TaxID=206335 RepID=A0A9P5QBN5_9AGAR|nr:hypothetical protein BDP27DRAFT_345111 [Rhodocollybia butyracea]